MKSLFKLLFVVVVALPLLVVILIWLCFQNAPLVVKPVDISPTDMERAERIIRLHDPRWTAPGSLRTIVASQQDIDLVLNYVAHRWGRAATNVVLQPGAALIHASLLVPASPFGQWLNVDTLVHETSGLPEVDYLKIGRVPVPGFVADYGLKRLMGWLNAEDAGQIAQDMVQSVKLTQSSLQVVYTWRKDLPDRLRAVVLPQQEQERLKVYSDRLADVVDTLPPSSISLAQLLPPLFNLAQQRSNSGDAVQENRAVLITLAFYANGRGLTALIPAARSWRRPAWRDVTLLKRDDFPQHFLISAAIAAHGDGPLSDAIGLYKEVKDSRGGSGFSFNDLGADRAGTRFGELAVQSPQKLQARLKQGLVESDFMPDVLDLPEFMPEAEFKRRYGGIGSPAYAKVMADIEARVAARPLFKP